ncbi:MAG: ATP-binding protein [Richelia sp. RM2_1_2]|nr:ATP-binding protein [Richelia sp. RM1_1_1]NJO27429.1 ATP-binding protein [Richelia sp. SL_2_1]NJO62974.1 ATP-binding protein [Richelia sp. RM2_1_2]
MRQHQNFSVAEQQILTLGRILETLREEDDADILIETTISYIKEQFDYSLIWIALYDRLNHILFGKGGVIPSSDDNSYLQQRVVLSPGDLLEQVVIQQRPMGVADLRLEKRAEGWQEIAVKLDIQGTIMLPIRYKDRCLGVLMLASKRWGYLIGSEAKAMLMIVVGELGAALFRLEMDLQHKQTKHPDQVLLRLLEKIRTLATLEQRLEAVVSATHQFIIPNRTNVYWFDPKEHSFWRRISTQHLNIGKLSQNKAENAVTVEDLSDFYYALSANQLVWIGEGRSSLKSYSTQKLLKRLDVRSLLVAPILWKKDLLGFLAVEGKEPRIWSEADKNFVKGAAGLISLVSLTQKMETSIQQIQEDAILKSQIVESIYNDENIEQALHSCSAKVLNRLAATRFLLLFREREESEYNFFYQSQPHNRRCLKFSLDKLKEVDAQLLERSTQAVGVEKLEDDLRFFNWRSSLLAAGVRSILVSNCTNQKESNAILMIASENNRSWTTTEKELIQVVAQQLGVIVRQWQLIQQNQHQQQIWHTFEQSLRILEPIQNTNLSEQEKQPEIIILEQIAAILNCPLTALLSWNPGEKFAQIIPGFVAGDRLFINTDTTISIHTDVLIHSAITTSGLVSVNTRDLPESTKQWLCGSAIGEILVIALRTAEYQPTGVILMADYHQRKWLPETLDAVKTLVNQLAWLRRQKQVTQLLHCKTEELQQLNWYKHRRFEDIRSNVVMLLSQMHDLGIPNNQLTLTRHQQLLRQLDNTVASTTALLKLEQWQLIFNRETILIASLIKHCLKGINKLLKQHKLWVGVHGLGQKLEDEQSYIDDDSLNSNSQLTINGDIVKIELILSELLIAACHRSQEGGRIDIWCRRLEQQIIEISITDNGSIHPQLLEELQQDMNSDILVPSKLKQPPMKHLIICKKLIKKLQGQLDFYQLPDSRIVSRLLLPIE